MLSKSSHKYIIAGLMRCWLIHTKYGQMISNRVEVATPLNSWKRLIEGVYLYEHNINPYEGDMFHESPIMLVFFHTLIKHIPAVLPLLFTLCDMLTAFLLHRTACMFMEMLRIQQKQEKTEYATESFPMLLKQSHFERVPVYVATVYLFNPFTILNCVGMTTTVLNNLFIAMTFYSMVNGRRILCCIAIALATHQALYPILLIVPASILISKVNAGCAKCSYIKTLLVFVLCWSFLIFTSAYIMDYSYSYVYNTYGFILTVPDLKPNIGLFWYFFTEMFEHFRLLFICSFQINALLLYVVPLTLRFRNEPMLLATTLVTLTTIFRPYPCVGDIGFYLSLFPMWKHLFSYMQQKLVVGCALVLCVSLGPAVWHLWIYSGSANANFFFGVTLTFATAQIFLITDLLFAYIKREFTLKNGSSRIVDGKQAKLVLK